MKKITICIAAKSFDITLDDDFAKFFENEADRIFKNKNNIEIKDILGAFIQECYDKFEIDKMEKKLITKLDFQID